MAEMADEKNVSDGDIAEALAESLGIDAGYSADDGKADEFFSLVRESEPVVPEEPKPEAAETPVEGAPRFVHEPTGREFDNELDYLKYNSGWTADKLGTENKELRERLERLETGSQQKQEAPVAGREEIMKQIWPDLDEETLKDPALRTIYQGLERTAEIMQSAALQREEALKGEIMSLRSQVEGDRVRAQFGVDNEVEQRILEKHPGLKAMPDKERLAVIAEMSRATRAAETSSPKLMDKIPQRKAEDHVEGSVSKSVPDSDNEGALEDKLFAMDDKDRLSVFGRMFETSELGRRLTEGDDF